MIWVPRTRAKGVSLCSFGSARADDFENANAAHDEGVGDQRAMAAPGNGFGAHQRGGSFRGEFDGALKPGFKFRRLHVIGIAAKAGVAPAEIDGVRAGVAQAAQAFQMAIADACGVQARGQRIGIELRIVAGFRDGANVDDAARCRGREAAR